MRYENFKIGRVPILTLIGRSKRGLSRRFVTKDSLDSEWDFISTTVVTNQVYQIIIIRVHSCQISSRLIRY